ncbi:MAG TPA: OmpA family protein [Polyangiaceae bacterium]|nr:OmpA family protein [Polyangiaceae bacterium]
MKRTKLMGLSSGCMLAFVAPIVAAQGTAPAAAPTSPAPAAAPAPATPTPAPATAPAPTPTPAPAPAPAPAPSSDASASASGAISFGSSGADASADSNAGAAAHEDADEYEPVPHQFELGLFAGMLFPSDVHNLRADTSRQQPYASVAPEFGLRIGYLPIKYAGLEVEGWVAPTKTDTSGDSATLFGARAHLIGQLPIGRITPFLLVGYGKIGGASTPMGTDIDPALHFGVGAKYALTPLVGLRLDLRDNMSQKTSTATHEAKDGDMTSHWEVSLGVSVALEPRHRCEKYEGPKDSDGDGFSDDRDRCPTQPGIAPDGCPDRDSDGDTVLDSHDRCPTQPGPVNLGGCPVRDGDGDGIPDDYDKCPTEPGPINGCPDLDPDHDGIPVPADQCPDKPETKNGFDDEDGCPDEIPEKLRKFTGVVKGIEFDTGKDTIRPVSESVLQNALAVFNEYPKARIEVSGHTDDVGQHDDNVELSRKRAESVKAWFVGKGVDPHRIETRGAGPDAPIADNKTPAGKQKNRRIEFKLLQ